MAQRPVVILRKPAAHAAQRGHPWIFREGISKAPAIEQGEVELRADDGSAIGTGLYDASSPIAARVWSPSPHDHVHDLLITRFARALDLRATLFDDSTNAYRIVHGEGDRVPGIVVDRYGDVAVLKPDGIAATELAKSCAQEMASLLARQGVTSLVLRERDQDACMLHGSAPSAPVLVKEHGVPFLVDVMKGQKTGAFLDQRENRRRVGTIVRGFRRAADKPVRLLNLFSYAGGFSIHAALAGATTTSVDVAAAAHKTAMDSFRAAGLDPKSHSFATADVFQFLDRAAAEKKSWDVVISDPPSFAPSERAVPRAIAAYRKLHHACVRVLAENGVFCAASCSSHVTANDFAGTLDDAALARSDLRVVESFGPPADHPTLAAWPEGRYLKFVVLA